MGRSKLALAAIAAALVVCSMWAGTAAAQDPNQSPTVSAARTPAGNVRVGVPIAFTATATDPDGDTLTYAWDFGDGTTSTEQNPTKVYLAAGTRTATVTVDDGRGGTASAQLTVVVQANRNPSANGLVMTPSAGFAPLEVTWTGAATDPDGPSHVVSYSWDLDGDGIDDSTAQNPTFTYSTPGTYSPRVRVTDPFGGSATRTFTLNVLSRDRDPNARFRVLIFSKTAGFRHSSIDEGITAIKLLGTQENFQVDAIEESTLFTDDVLGLYDGVIWLSTTGDALTDPQQAAFERYIQGGGAYVGIHSAADTEYLWPWYGRLVGGYFRNHPNGTPTATVVREDATHDSTAHLLDRWTRVDEWYNYQGIVNPVVNGGGVDYSPRNSGVHVLLTMDESTYAEADGSDGVNDDHPIAWCQRYDGGRMWYSGMGHTEASYVNADFMRHVLGGIETAVEAVPDAACGNRLPAVAASADPASGIAPLTTTFTADATDADADDLTYAWDFDGDGTTDSTLQSPTRTFADQGTYTATVTVTDEHGAASSATTSVEAFENQAPVTTSVLSPAAPNGQNGWYIGPVTVTLGATDNDGGSGVDKTEYRIDGGAWTVYSGPFAVGSDGGHTVGYRSTDVVGNVEAEKTVSFKVDNPILGTRQLGPSTDTLSNRQPEAYSNVAKTTGAVSELNVFLTNATTAGFVVAGIYADAGGHPGRLLAQSPATAVSRNAWNRVSFGAVQIAEGQPYWIAVKGTGGVLKIRTYSGGAGTQDSETGPVRNVTALPSAWTTDRVYRNDGPLSAYAVPQG